MFAVNAERDQCETVRRNSGTDRNGSLDYHPGDRHVFKHESSLNESVSGR
jgi:hypothetical protein